MAMLERSSIIDPVVLVLGLGASGEAAAQLLLRQGKRVVVLDAGASAALGTKAQKLRGQGCQVFIGTRNLPETQIEFVVVSPGIPETDPWVFELRKRGHKVISELELGWGACRSRILAVTGSNGKSTLVKLCCESLQKAGFSAVAGGNYGTPLSALACLEPVPQWVVVEVSSFQLETVDQFVPDTGILLNINPNHLDRHGTMDGYSDMKARLFRRMDLRNVAVVPEAIADRIRAALPGMPCGHFWAIPAINFFLSGGKHSRFRFVGAGLCGWLFF